LTSNQQIERGPDLCYTLHTFIYYNQMFISQSNCCEQALPNIANTTQLRELCKKTYT